MYYFEMDINVYKYIDYREALSVVLEKLKDRGMKVNLSLLATAIDVQKTYVSRVFRREAHFSSDQLYQCCEYLKLSADEFFYLNLLLEHDRASAKGRKKILWEQIQGLQNEETRIQKHSKAHMLESKNSVRYLEYYMDPRMALVHTYLLIDSYRIKPALISQALNLTNSQLAKILLVLENLEIIKFNKNRGTYEVKVRHLHLTKESPLSFPAEQLTRMMVIDHLKKLNPNQKFYYSFTFAADEAARVFVHQEFLKFLRAIEPAIEKAPSEDVFHMTFDLFPWKVER